MAPVLLRENPIDRGAWWVTVHGVTKSQTQLRDGAHAHAWVCMGAWALGTEKSKDKTDLLPLFRAYCAGRPKWMHIN